MFSIEHALNMYASGYCVLPASGIYDQSVLESIKVVAEESHIYIIGFVPKICTIDFRQIENELIVTVRVLDKDYDVALPIPRGMKLIDINGMVCLEDSESNRFWYDELTITQQVNLQYEILGFDVKYIGQAYGSNGSRNCIDRLKKHETLQKISLLGIPEGYQLSVLMLEMKQSNQLITAMNPYAKNNDTEGARIRAGIDKVYNLTDAEIVSLYEAALIRYFSPEFNKEFKNSFPSTNLKILQDCYDKDFSAVIAEICIDELPFTLYSDKVKPKRYHIATFQLHADQSRHAFFSGQE